MNEEDEPVERLLFFSVGLAAAWIFGVTAVRLGNEAQTGQRGPSGQRRPSRYFRADSWFIRHPPDRRPWRHRS
jgi:hypothetical protein